MRRLGFISLITCAVAAASVANAADLPPQVPAKSPITAAPYNWSGLYVGLNVGYGWATASSKGVIGGGQLGYNMQTGNMVWGLETDIQASGVKTTQTSSDGGDTLNETYKLTWFGTTRGRVGVAMDRYLPYLTGGVAYGQRKGEGTMTGAITGNYTTTATKVGWTVGGGLEAAIGGNWTAKFEYLYLTLPGYTTMVNGTGGTLEIEYNKYSAHIARLGVNYRF